MSEQTVNIETPPFPPPQPPPAAPAPRWYQRPVSRDPSDHKLGGVISGLSRSYGFDIRTTRIAVAIATIVLPVIAVLYVAAWALLPARPEEASSLEHIAKDRKRVPLYLAIGLVLVAGGLGSFGSWFFLGGLPWGLGLIAVGVLLWVAPSLGRSSTDAPAPTSPGTMAATPMTPPVTPAPSTTAAQPVVTDATTTMTWAPARPLQMDDLRTTRRRRYPIASLAVLGVLAFIGIASAGDAADWWDIPVLTTVVVSLVATITGAVAGAIVNRSWMTFAVVPMLTVATVGLLIVQPDLDGGIGDRTIEATTVAGAERHQQLGIGQLTVDLTRVPLGADTVDVRAEVGTGHLHVLVPRDVTIVLDAEVRAGDVVVDDLSVADGFHERAERTFAAEGTSAGTVHLDLEIGAGHIEIDRVLAPR
ncbi:MAG: PspC domain-containing protein [Ilumatobacteraceae bacterium]